MRRSIYTFFSAILLIASMLQGCHGSGAAGEKQGADSTSAVPAYKVVSVEKGRLASTLEIPGELVAFQQVDLYSKVNSFVRKMYADVGSEVKAGQLLAIMEAPEINSQLTGAESRLKSAEALYIASKAYYERLLETSKTPGTISPSDLDAALAKQNSDYAQLQAAKAAHNEITDNRNYLEIRAPFSGVISARNVSAGAYVGPSGKGSELPVFTLQEQRQLRLVVAVPEAYTGYLDNSSEVDFTVKTFPGKPFKAKVKRMAGVLDNRLRSERIEMDVINADKKLLPGMVAEIKLTLPARDSTFIVPKSAVVNSPERIFVIKVNNGKAEWVTVHKGRESEGKAEIYGQLNVGDMVVEKATEEIRNGAAVEVAK
ncbi:MAG: efflux RND transporter periplasmic adaptor subunit [Chitinophagaceae bacterium]|nr:efflux RND transporter periplasmic adaptor subunit [Chitinophagaceae bacterium]